MGGIKFTLNPLKGPDCTKQKGKNIIKKVEKWKSFLNQSFDGYRFNSDSIFPI